MTVGGGKGPAEVVGTRTSGDVRVRPATPSDHGAVHALNQAAVPAMGAVDPAFFDRLASLAVVFLVAECRDVAEGQRRVVGFLLALPPHVPYDSPNYQWFEERYDDFVYIDRVAVAPGDRGSGVGRALYEALDATLAARTAAPAGPARLCCEVNLRPPNPGSLAFHRRLGFLPVGEQDTEAGAKRVALLVREPPSAAPEGGGAS